MRLTKALLPCLAVCSVLFVLSHRADAKPEFAKTEKKGCTTCHVSAKSKELNDTGKYYKQNKKLPPAKQS